MLGYHSTPGDLARRRQKDRAERDRLRVGPLAAIRLALDAARCHALPCPTCQSPLQTHSDGQLLRCATADGAPAPRPSKRPLAMSDVVSVLACAGLASSSGPNGVAFTAGGMRFRVESGSGIAGRGNAWNVVRVDSGEALGPKVTTRRALRAQVLAARTLPRGDGKAGGAP